VNDSLLIDQRQRWEQGDRILVETYLKERPGVVSDTNHILELIGRNRPPAQAARQNWGPSTR
jgi:hypothetical protein